MIIESNPKANDLAIILRKLWPEIIVDAESRMKTIATAFGFKKDEFDKIFLGSANETANCTPLLQKLFTTSILFVCGKNNISLREEDVAGWDYVFEDLKVEQKIRSYLGNSKNATMKKRMSKKQFLNFEGYTGTKASFISENGKTDIHLVISLLLVGSKIKASFAALISLSETGSVWTCDITKKGGFSGLRMAQCESGIALICGNIITPEFHQFVKKNGELSKLYFYGELC